jgi:hypothetical protein
MTVIQKNLRQKDAAARSNGARPHSLTEAEAVRRSGKSYCWRKLGDALGVDLPVWNGDVWIADLLLRDHDGSVGRLVFSRDGEVIVERSSSKAEILEGLDAPRAEAATA